MFYGKYISLHNKIFLKFIFTIFNAEQNNKTLVETCAHNPSAKSKEQIIYKKHDNENNQ